MRDLKKYNDRIDVSEKLIIDGIKFVLSHFENQDSLFPRIISTNINPQTIIEYDTSIQNNINSIFEIFKKSNYYNCKINSLNYNIEDSKKNDSNKRTCLFILINLNLKENSFNKKNLDYNLENTLNKMDLKLDKVHPTVVWNGLGYEIYQPLEISTFESRKYNEFRSYIRDGDINNEFLRFSKKLFTDTRIENPSCTMISNYISVPGTFNFENGEQVKIIQKWDGKRPSILWINNDFKNYLIRRK